MSTSSSIDDLTNRDNNAIDSSKYNEQQQLLQDLENDSEEKERILTLSRVNLSSNPGELVCIVGQVGSGKSSKSLSLSLSFLSFSSTLISKYVFFSN
jgi:ABC-type lipoprotein export system ATPase subunit